MSVVLHVGLPKTGTTYLQDLLATHRERLREAGVLYPFVRPAAMFHAAVEIRGSAEKFGLDAGDIAGTWTRLCELARSYEGTTVLGHEVLAGATPEQVARALAPLAGLDVHVVVTARDLGRQATAHWQEEVKLGATYSFAELEQRQLRCDTGPDLGPDAGGVRPHFWHAQDFADCLRRWGAGLPPANAHLVVCPAPGAPAEVLWERFADAAGIDPALVTPEPTAANPSLAAPEIALLRRVNEILGDRIGVEDRLRLVKRGWAETDLAHRPGARPLAPASLGEVLRAATEALLEDVRRSGHPLHGEPSDLAPVLGAADDPPPDALPPHDEDPRALALGFLAAASVNQIDAGPIRGVRRWISRRP